MRANPHRAEQGGHGRSRIQGLGDPVTTAAADAPRTLADAPPLLLVFLGVTVITSKRGRSLLSGGVRAEASFDTSTEQGGHGAPATAGSKANPNEGGGCTMMEAAPNPSRHGSHAHLRSCSSSSAPPTRTQRPLRRQGWLLELEVKVSGKVCILD